MDYDYDVYENYVPDEGDMYYYPNMYDEDENDQKSMTFYEVCKHCLKPTFYDTMSNISHVLLWCLLFRISTQVIKTPTQFQHVICLATGMLSLHMLFSSTFYYIILLIILSYILLFISTYFQYVKHRGALIVLSSLVFLVVCELWLVEPKQWHRIRGPQMIVVMKSVSLAFDLDIGTVKEIPNLVYYSGYMLCPGTCVFGPWISYNDYLSIYRQPKWNFRWLRRIFCSLGLAFVFLSISTCWCNYVIPDDSWKWFITYRSALSFRTSHYFISFLSEATSVLSGCDISGFNQEKLAVSRPQLIEFPRSIINVVIYWNIPMHNWLKVYVFNTSRRFGNFIAILSTYTVSALLHGLNFQLSAVLLSIGLYSYVELMIRKKLAVVFSACILAKRCKSDCSHKHHHKQPVVFITNTFFTIITMIHLAYLGVVFDSDNQQEETGYSYRHTLEKWSNLNYLSHYIAFLTYLIQYEPTTRSTTDNGLAMCAVNCIYLGEGESIYGGKNMTRITFNAVVSDDQTTAKENDFGLEDM